MTRRDFGRPALLTALLGAAIVAGACGAGQGSPTDSVALPTPTPTMTTSPPSATPIATQSAMPSDAPEPIGHRIQAGSNVSRPFAPPRGFGVCVIPPQTGCRESSADDSIRITFIVPDGWASGFDDAAITKVTTPTYGPSGMSLHFLRGGWLFSDPCLKVDTVPDMPVGPSVDDFADALAAHPKLDVTTPVDVSLDGYSGKYLDLQVPSDIDECTGNYYPWAPAFYAQGPNHRWHVRILDVDGVRVVIQNGDFEGTVPQDLAEMHAIIESIKIEP
jgi:hypothetical protein